MPNLLADEGFNAVVVQLHLLFLECTGLHLHHLADKFGAADFLKEQYSPLGSIFKHKRVASPFIAERCICFESVALGSLPYGHRIEISNLEEEFSCAFGNSGISASEHTGQTHRSIFVCNDKVFGRKTALNSVQCHKLFSFASPADHDLASGNLRRIEGVKRLSELHKNEIGYIHHIVYRSEAHRKQFFLQPLRGRSNLYIRQACPEISRCIVFSKDFHRNGIRFASVFSKG